MDHQHIDSQASVSSPSWPSVYDDITNINITLSPSDGASPIPSNTAINHHQQQPMIISQPSTSTPSPLPSQNLLATDTPPAMNKSSHGTPNTSGQINTQHMQGINPNAIGSTGTSAVASPQDYQSLFDFSHINLDPSHDFSHPGPTSPMFSQLQAQAQSQSSQPQPQPQLQTPMSPRSQLQSISNQLQQLQQMQQFQQYQNIQHLQNQIQQLQQQHFQQQQQQPSSQPHSQAGSPSSNVSNNSNTGGNLRVQAAQNNQTLNLLQNHGNMDTFFRELFQDYNNTGNLDSLMIDTALAGASTSGATMPPPTPSTMESQNTVMTNDIFRSPMTGPLDNSATSGSTATTEDFTPLMSPAVTPFDSINPGIVPPTSDFTMPSSYFSAVTSSVLEEKHMPTAGATTIPQGSQAQIQQRPPPARRQRRVNSRKTTPVLAPMISKPHSGSVSSTSSASSRISKASPMIRPSRRSSSNLPSLASSANTSPLIQAIPSSTLGLTSLAAVSSSNNSNNSSDHQAGWSSDSVSPESGVTDILMPPPQKKSARKQSAASIARKSSSSGLSSAIGSGNSSTVTLNASNSSSQTQFLVPSKKRGSIATTITEKSSPGFVAATPASLMNLPEQNDVEMLDAESTEQHLNNAVNASQNVEKQEQQHSKKINLPPPSAKSLSRKKSVSMSPLTCAPTNGISGSPSLSNSLKASAVTAVSSRRGGSRQGSITKAMLPSPSLNPIKPKIAIQPNQSAWKSRHGSSSSPIIRPKISPHISPRINSSHSSHGYSNGGGIAIASKGGSSSPTLNADISLVLASKSNYQNIVEGTHSQLGLSYPDSLSTDLTSKRTSHKLAEQGRRNRINSALADLAKLLEPTHQTSSKALTVEMAIEYIKSLQMEITETKSRLSKYEEVDPNMTSVFDALRAQRGDTNKRDDEELDDIEEQKESNTSKSNGISNPQSKTSELINSDTTAQDLKNSAVNRSIESSPQSTTATTVQ